eukprot:TRINITY_DN27075_c0_g1_i1.p1 TRINITY_DN27075_c0_g1~~TRINITY_DN27075_c0_g1_i1.p1  ORF type:complete len:468 (+),score=79.52 TRINITY_DN27075_c0_g1_i1:156-1559(+)
MVSPGEPAAKRQRRGGEEDAVPLHAAPEALCRVRSLVQRFTHTPDASKIVFVMVGLPARGKSFIAMRLARFLRWAGMDTQVFNAGNHRRSTEIGVQDASYFDPDAPAAAKRREEIAKEVMEEMLLWLDERDERFAIFDATNTTKARRQILAETLTSRGEIGVIFIESHCTDPHVLDANVSLKLNKSPDYASMPREKAREDLAQRIKNYEKVYEPLDEEEFMVGEEKLHMSYIKLINLSSHVVAHHVYGRAATVVLPFLMALHVGSRPIWLVRLPQSEVTPVSWRKEGKKWPPPQEVRFADQPLDSKGLAFAASLAKFVKKHASDVAVFSCSHRRGLDAAALLGGAKVRTSLNPQDRGSCAGLSAAELATYAPDILADPRHTRFPGGECLADMIQKLIPTIIEFSQEMRPVVVFLPLSTLRILHCYYTNRPVVEALTGPVVPMHSVVEFRNDGGHFKERRISATELEA